MTRNAAWWIGGAALALAGAAATAFLVQRGSAAVLPAQASELERMHAACVEAMVRSTCRVMTGPQAASTATVVFVAGIGPVDAQAYRELRDSGDAMCSVLRSACTRDWNGAQCRTARGLYGAASAPR